MLVGALQTYGQGVDAATQSLLAPTADFTKLEPGEEKPGGGATSRGSTNTTNAFSLSSGNMDFKRELNFKIGNAIFRKDWVSAPPRPTPPTASARCSTLAAARIAI